MNYGFVPSKMDGSETKFKKIRDFEIPNEYSYRKYLPSVIDQGNKPICVPCSLSAYINWVINTDTGENKIDNEVDLQEIFDSSSVKSSEGMTFKDGLKFLKHEGVSTKEGVETIDRYATIGSMICLKQALILNGPCVGALPVYDSRVTEFWDSAYGDCKNKFKTQKNCFVYYHTDCTRGGCCVAASIHPVRLSDDPTISVCFCGNR